MKKRNEKNVFPYFCPILLCREKNVGKFLLQRSWERFFFLLIKQRGKQSAYQSGILSNIECKRKDV